MFGKILLILFSIPLVLITLHTIIRVIRRFYKFPMPEFMAEGIDNPVRRRIQVPDETPARLGIQPGMRILEIGPGNGTYSLASARAAGKDGHLISIDIEPQMAKRAADRFTAEQTTNIDVSTANAYDLPFQDETFDLVYMITVVGEIPEPQKAAREFSRVLKPGGILSFGELFMDPDYPLHGTVTRWIQPTGFHLKEKTGNFIYYTLQFTKPGEAPAA